MSAATDTLTPTQTPAASRVEVKPVTLPRVIHSEWIKLRTLRSTFWTYGVAIVTWIGFIALAAWAISTTSQSGPGETGVTVETTGSMEESVLGFGAQGIQMVQLVVVIIGVLFITGEYSTGMIRSTLSAVPRRLDALWAKALVISGVTFVVSLIGSFAAYFVHIPFMNDMDIHPSLGDPHQLRIIVGAALYLTVVALLSLGIGAIIRNSAGAIAVTMGIMLVLPILVNILPGSWSEKIAPWLPTSAGAQIVLPPAPGATLGNWQGLAVFAVYALVALFVGAALMKKRDA